MADDAKLIAIVEANTKQFENALKRLEGVTKGSTDRMTRSVQKLDASFVGVGGRVDVASRKLSGFARGFTGTGIISSIAAIIRKTIEMNDALREQGIITAETHAEIKGLGNAWEGASQQMARATSNFVAGARTEIGGLASVTEDLLSILADVAKFEDLLTHGNLKEALEFARGRYTTSGNAGVRIAGALDAAAAAPSGLSAETGDLTARLLAKEEGFRSTPYWDTNRLRIGFGSSTTTKLNAQGVQQIADVTAESTVDVADAMRDLQRRIIEFQHVIEAQISPEVFRALTPGAQAALTSVAYNYGHLPSSVAKAAKTLNNLAIAGAIQGLPANPERRAREARVALGDTPAGDVLEEQIEAKKKSLDEKIAAAKKAVEEAAKKSKEEEEKALKKLNDLEEERNQLVFDRALKSGEITGEMEAQADAINEGMAFNRDLVGGFVKDLEKGVKPAEALANAIGKIADRLLDMALNAIFPDVVAGAIGGGKGLLGGAIIPGFLAEGGVMTSHGQMPLKRYQSGGVAHSPQLAVFGEGSGAEAFVPLPDGRRIPVNLRVPGMGVLGGGHGRQGTDVRIAVKSEPSPLLITTTHAIARQAGRDGVVETMDGNRRRPGGR